MELVDAWLNFDNTPLTNDKLITGALFPEIVVSTMADNIHY